MQVPQPTTLAAAFGNPFARVPRQAAASQVTVQRRVAAGARRPTPVPDPRIADTPTDISALLPSSSHLDDAPSSRSRQPFHGHTYADLLNHHQQNDLRDQVGLRPACLMHKNHEMHCNKDVTSHLNAAAIL